MARASTEDVSIAYDDLGTGAPALLFTTGWCSSKERWSSVARLCAARRRVLSMEWRGHGSSEPAVGDFGAEEMIADVLAVADAAGVEQFIPCAASHSGFVALELRRRFPARVPMLVHVDWYVIPPPPPYRSVLEMLTSSDDWPAARDRLFEIWRAGVEAPAIDAALDVMRHHGAEMWMRSGREIMAGYDREGSPLDAWGALDPPVPVLHVYGQPADPTFLEKQRAYAEEHPWFTVKKLPGVTHFAMIETPEQVAAAINAFVDTDAP